MDTKIKPENETIKPTYVSQEGFTQAKVLRGFTEIKPVYEALLWGVPNMIIVCGGYVRFMCSPNRNPSKPSDLDLYSVDETTFRKLRKQMLEKHQMKIRHENEMALTLGKPELAEHPFAFCPTIQLIKPIQEGAVVARGSIETILENFDFTVIRCGLLSYDTALVDADFMHDEEKKIIRIKNIHCPISSTLRCMKYSKKGYWLPPTQALKLFLNWENRDEEYRLKLIDYLEKTEAGEGLTQEQIDELEKLMRID